MDSSFLACVIKFSIFLQTTGDEADRIISCCIVFFELLFVCYLEQLEVFHSIVCSVKKKKKILSGQNNTKKWFCQVYLEFSKKQN